MLQWEEAFNNHEAYLEFDQRFHEIIFGVMKNDTLLKLTKVFWVAFENYGNVDLLMAPDPLRVIREQQDVVDAIKLRDPDLARKELLQQFIGFGERIDEIATKSPDVEPR